jgi:hypothetical protein
MEDHPDGFAGLSEAAVAVAAHPPQRSRPRDTTALRRNPCDQPRALDLALGSRDPHRVRQIIERQSTPEHLRATARATPTARIDASLRVVQSTGALRAPVGTVRRRSRSAASNRLGAGGLIARLSLAGATEQEMIEITAVSFGHTKEHEQITALHTPALRTSSATWPRTRAAIAGH